MNVKVSDGYVVEIGKYISAKDADGQSAQLAKFSGESVKDLRNEVTRLVSNHELYKFPTDAYKPIIENYGLKAVDVKDMAWAEVDTSEDYKYVCENFCKEFINS